MVYSHIITNFELSYEATSSLVRRIVCMSMLGR